MLVAKVIVKPTMSRISLLLLEAEAEPTQKCNYNDILQVQVGFYPSMIFIALAYNSGDQNALIMIGMPVCRVLSI